MSGGWTLPIFLRQVLPESSVAAREARNIRNDYSERLPYLLDITSLCESAPCFSPLQFLPCCYLLLPGSAALCYSLHPVRRSSGQN